MCEILRIIGPESLSKLAGRYGGINIKIPTARDSRRWHNLVAIIGENAAQALVEYAKGDDLYIPRQEEIERQKRYEAIRNLHQDGLTPAQIARSFSYQSRYTERQIFNILAKTDPLRKPCKA